jgi:hypothetical protein
MSQTNMQICTVGATTKMVNWAQVIHTHVTNFRKFEFSIARSSYCDAKMFSAASILVSDYLRAIR